MKIEMAKLYGRSYYYYLDLVKLKLLTPSPTQIFMIDSCVFEFRTQDFQ